VEVQLISKGNTSHNPRIPDGALIDFEYTQGTATEPKSVIPAGTRPIPTFTLDVYEPKGNHVDHLAGAVVATRLTVDSTLPTSIPSNP
jgi:hypothetical protein